MYSKDNYPSKLLEDAVESISSLPGVGKRSALRLALHLLRQPQENVHHFTESINALRDNIRYCSVCPSDLTIKELVDRVAGMCRMQGAPEEDGPDGEAEVIMALGGGVEGETTSFYIYRQLAPFHLKVSSLARGLGFGDDLEYADELTLGRSIVNRQPFKP